MNWLFKNNQRNALLKNKVWGLGGKRSDQYKCFMDPSEFLSPLNPTTEDQILIRYYFYIFRTTFHSQIQGDNGIENIHRKRLA